MTLDLPLLFALVLAFGVAMYVVMDGFDLGIGILFLLAPSDADRDAMMNSVAPIWDGNETWLVLGGTLLIGAFPVAYGTLLPALYVPLVLMLFALIFRGIAFEFRFRAARFRRVWDWAFAGGSMLAGFSQGVVLGAFIDGAAEPPQPLGFFSAFALVCGLGLLAGYVLLGATWLILKTAGSTAAFGRRAARPALLATLAVIALVSIWTPLAHEPILERWFSLPNILFLWPVPFVTAATAVVIWRTVPGTREALPFLGSIFLFLLALSGLGVSIFPYAVPWRVTLWQAASSTPTLDFIGVGVLVILPIILAYLGFAHWVFRGKADAGTGYGH
ncbi:MAG TPA: cytochrome d ubiquinol oxidase subunit II [Stellaceae bacterium]|nr:cytochrome d ubiquinol oxidase subunit II [Stellaceae bacterium]